MFRIVSQGLRVGGVPPAMRDIVKRRRRTQRMRQATPWARSQALRTASRASLRCDGIAAHPAPNRRTWERVWSSPREVVHPYS